MPIYRVEIDGRIYRIEGDRPPTEQEARDAVGVPAPMRTPPTPAELPTPKAPTPTTAATTPPLRSEHTTLENVLGALNTIPKQIQQGVASGIDLAQGETTLAEAMKKQAAALSLSSPVTSETALEAAGMGEGKLRSAIGLGLDILTPAGLPGKVGKALGASATLAEQMANPLGTALRAGGAVAKKIPGVTDALTAAQKPFVKYAGLDKFKGRTNPDMTMQDYMRLHDSTLDAAATTSKHEVASIMKGLSERDQWDIASFLRDSKYKLPANRPDLQEAAFKLRKTFGDQAAALVNMGFLDPATVVGKDYFPQVRKSAENPRALVVDDLNATDRFVKQRTVPWEKHIADPTAVNPAKAAQTRLAAGDRAMKTSDLLSLVGQEFGQNIKAHGPLPAGYRPINLKLINVPEQQKAVLKTMAFPKEIAETLERASVLEADPEGWRKMWIGTNRAFKALVTTFNPSHHVNNWQGNVYLMYLGGMKPADIVKAYGKIPELQAMMNGDKLAPAVQAIRNKSLGKLSVGEAYDEARRYNVFGSSEAAIEFDRFSGAKPGHPVVEAGANLADKVRFKTSRVVEDPARWALFKDQILKGKTPEQAALHVKKYLFDYNELTDMEKALRDYGVVPFYTFLRKNLPLHVTSIAENPDRLRKAQLAYSAPGRIQDPKGEALLADWQKEEGYQPIGSADAEGSIPLARFANPGLDLNKVPLIGSTRSLIKSSVGPVPTAVTEFATGRDLRTGAPVLDTPTGYAAASPLGTLGATIQMKTGIPMPRFGTVPNEDGTGFIQREKIALAMSQIPVPLLPYAQRIAGAPGETLGSQLNAGPGKILKELILRSLGLTPRALTLEQQDKVVEDALKAMFAPEDQRLIREMGEAMMRGPQKK